MYMYMKELKETVNGGHVGSSQRPNYIYVPTYRRSASFVDVLVPVNKLSVLSEHFMGCTSTMMRKCKC